MEKSKPLRPRNMRYELLVCLEIAAIIGVWWLAVRSVQGAILFGGLTYLALAWALRLSLQRHHRRGMRRMRAERFAEAIPAFQASQDFFQRHPWVDRYRYVTMFASSALSYRQMALNNLGICYARTGEISRALETFTQLRALYPDHPNVDVLVDMLRESAAQAQGEAN